jgi:hypothetical protein
VPWPDWPPRRRRSTLAAAALQVEPYGLVPSWRAFTGKSPSDIWSVSLGLALPEAVRHEHSQWRLAALLDDVEGGTGHYQTAWRRL